MPPDLPDEPTVSADDWPDDQPWVLATDDGDHELDLPAPAATALHAALAAIAGAIAAGPLPDVDVVDATGRPLDADLVWDLSGQAVIRIGELLAVGTLDPDLVAELADHAENLTIVSRNVDPTGAGAGAFTAAADVLDRLATETREASVRRIRRRRDGRFQLRLSSADRDTLSALAAELSETIGSDDPGQARLFPAAYGTDEQRSREWAALAHHELIDAKQASMARVQEVLDRTTLDADDLTSLLLVINDLRLVIGTRLDLDEDDRVAPPRGTPESVMWHQYHWLSALLGDVIAALRTTL